MPLKSICFLFACGTQRKGNQFRKMVFREGVFLQKSLFEREIENDFDAQGYA
jgi:hypothetical protein